MQQLISSEGDHCLPEIDEWDETLGKLDTHELACLIHAYVTARYPQAAQLDEALAVEFIREDTYYRLMIIPAQTEKFLPLSPREQEIARLVAQGYPNKVIARQLNISHWTVASYIKRIFSKLNVSTRSEMIACAMKYGLIAAYRL